MRKYTAIAKIYPDKFVKYRTSNPENLIKFLQQKFGNVLYVNFFNKLTKKQIGNWTKYKGLNL